MKKLKQVKLCVFFILLTLFSCSDDNELVNTNFKTNENFVELSKIKEIAEGIPFETKNKFLSHKGIIANSTKKTVETIDEIKNEEGITSFYVINYSKGGFVLLSADKRIQPIIAYSENNKFSFNENDYNSGLKFWMKKTKKQITEIQKSSIKQSDKTKLVWEKIQSATDTKGLSKKEIILPPGDDDEDIPVDQCYDHIVTVTKGPLLSSKWYQYNGFNGALGYNTCEGEPKQFYAGCLPIALAQVMKYHQYPTSYNWSSMPMNSATITTANFINDIHTSIGNEFSGNPNYTCKGTEVGHNLDMGIVLKNQFNYSSASFGNYDYQIVKGNILAGRPVILQGLEPNLVSGHAWVCDGYSATSYYFDDCSGRSYLYLNMNWGFYDGMNNGYFSFNNFSPDTWNFNYDVKILYNIRP